VLQQAAQPLATGDVLKAEFSRRLGWRQARRDRHVAQPLTGTELVIVGEPLAKKLTRNRRSGGRLEVVVPLSNSTRWGEPPPGIRQHASAAELAEGVKKALASENRAVAERARAVTREHFTASAMGRRWTEYLLKLVASWRTDWQFF